MWTCPRCGHRFVNTNQSHSCGSYTLDDFFRGKSRPAVALAKEFLRRYRRIGPFDLHPVKTRVALLTKMRFCAINRIGDGFVNLHLVLTDPYPEAHCFKKIDNLGDRFFVHHVRLERGSDISAELRKYMRLAYDVGQRKHVEGAAARASGRRRPR